MSYDVSFNAKLEGMDSVVCVGDTNHSWNGNKMVLEIMGITPQGFNGMVCEELLPRLSQCIIEIKYNREKYEHYMPDNKWGTIESWLNFLDYIESKCIEYPKAIIEVC